MRYMLFYFHSVTRIDKKSFEFLVYSGILKIEYKFFLDSDVIKTVRRFIISMLKLNSTSTRQK